jgi:tetraacyldisaccharide 4'-kinase
MTLGQAAGRRWHALAGIGDPDRFFDQLEAQGLGIVRHARPDHARLDPEDLNFGDGLPVIMTEKDAVKCRTFARENCWMLPVEARFSAGDEERLLAPVLACLGDRAADQG